MSWSERLKKNDLVFRHLKHDTKLVATICYGREDSLGLVPYGIAVVNPNDKNVSREMGRTISYYRCFMAKKTANYGNRLKNNSLCTLLDLKWEQHGQLRFFGKTKLLDIQTLSDMLNVVNQKILMNRMEQLRKIWINTLQSAQSTHQELVLTPPAIWLIDQAGHVFCEMNCTADGIINQHDYTMKHDK